MWARHSESSEAYSLGRISGFESFHSTMLSPVSGEAPRGQLTDDHPGCPGLTAPAPDISVSSHDSGVADRDLAEPDGQSDKSVPLSSPLSQTYSHQTPTTTTGTGRPLTSTSARRPQHHQELYLPSEWQSSPVILRSRDGQASSRNLDLMFGYRRHRPQSPPVPRVQSVSDRFYNDSGDPRINAPPEWNISNDEEPIARRAQLKQSKKLPGWAWYLLSKSLGVKSKPNEKPILATFLHVLTLTFGFAFFASYTWHKVYDIVSVMTKSTVLTGTVEILICLCWVALTIYANKCAARLFSSKNFVGSVRLHSKTIFKLSAVGVIGFLAVTFMVVNSYHASNSFQDQHCLSVNLSSVVCKVVFPARVSFNVFGIVWNLMVASVLLSVCRTHTVGIRRFIKEMEMDGKRYEKFWKETMSDTSQPLLDLDNLENLSDSELGSEWCVWGDRTPGVTPEEDCGRQEAGLRRRQWGSKRYRRLTSEVSGTASEKGDPGDQSGTVTSRSSQHLSADYSQSRSIPVPEVGPGGGQSPTVKQGGGSSVPETEGCVPLARPSADSQTAEVTPVHIPPAMESVCADIDLPPIMTNEDILLCYWKISCRMRVTSICLQRWLSSWIAFVVLWCANYVIYWTSHDATIMAIVEFVIPLLMIPLLASAYAEANTEGQRMIRSICPVQERLPLLFYLSQQPLQMTVFNFPVTYQGIVGVIAAFSVAFASRIVLDEVITK